MTHVIMKIDDKIYHYNVIQLYKTHIGTVIDKSVKKLKCCQTIIENVKQTQTPSFIIVSSAQL